MKFCNRRSYQSSSYKYVKNSLETSQTDRDNNSRSIRFLKRSSRLILPSAQSKFYHADLIQNSKRKRNHELYLAKSNILPQSSQKSKRQTSEEVSNQNKNIRIRQKPNTSLFKYHRGFQDLKVLDVPNQKQLLKYNQFSIAGHKNRPNQDRILCNQNVFVICDGHGPDGGIVSSFVSQKLLNHALINKNILEPQEQTIKKSFQYANQQLMSQSCINTQISGSTALMVKIQNKTVFCANSGDCRAIMGKKGHFVQLNNLHKPDKPRERDRIFRMGGEIKKNGTGPYRIYNPQKRYGVGGLAVSRGFGDSALRGWGLIHQPQVMKFQINDDCEFILIGSDGFFEFFPLEDVTNLTYKLLRKNVANLAEELVQEAVGRWEGFSQTDDISCIIIIL